MARVLAWDYFFNWIRALEDGGQPGEVEPVDEHARRHQENVLQELGDKIQ